MSANKTKSRSKQLPLRTLVFAFFVLSLLIPVIIFVNLSSRSTKLIDDSIRVKTYLSIAFERVQALYGTIYGPFVNKPLEKETKSISKRGYTLLIDNTVSVKRLTQSFPVTYNIQGNINKTNEATMQYNTLGNPIIGATDNKRKDECNHCFNHDFSYVIENLDICKLYSGQSEIELLIIILTIHNNIQQRNALRETWLTYSKNNTANVRYAFLLGEINDAKLQADVIKESDLFRDIIKEDFADVYSNLTYKTMMGFKWAVTKCGVTKAVLKTDDDMYINVPNVLDIVRNNFSLLQTNVVGHCVQRTDPVRNPKSKWFTSIKSYPRKFYPGFCSGTGYLTSINVAQKVFEISPHVPFFHLEDVYVALCVQKLGYHLKGFQGFNTDHPKLDACVYNGKSLVTAHYMTSTMIKQMWNAKCVSRSI